jgi:hypothetical protein
LKCCACDKEFMVDARRASSAKACSIACSAFLRRKVTRPTREVLATEMDLHSWTGLGKKYGVVPNVIKNWAKDYDIQFQPRRKPSPRDVRRLP